MVPGANSEPDKRDPKNAGNARSGKKRPTSEPHTAERYKQAATLHKLLSEPSRLAILGLLSERQRNVGEICAALGMQQPAVSHHLALFRVSGLIEQQRAGKSVFYLLTDRGRLVFQATDVLTNS